MVVVLLCGIQTMHRAVKLVPLITCASLFLWVRITLRWFLHRSRRHHARVWILACVELIGSEVPVCVFTWSKTWDFLQNVTDHVRWDCVVLGIQSSAWPDLEKVGSAFVELIRLIFVYVFSVVRDAMLINWPSMNISIGRHEPLTSEV